MRSEVEPQSGHTPGNGALDRRVPVVCRAHRHDGHTHGRPVYAAERGMHIGHSEATGGDSWTQGTVPGENQS